MERIENPMAMPIIEIVEMCKHCNGLGVIECTTCDYCKSHEPFMSDCSRCVIADIFISIDCPECKGNKFFIIEK